jgi:hypothetical protein
MIPSMSWIRPTTVEGGHGAGYRRRLPHLGLDQHIGVDRHGILPN